MYFKFHVMPLNKGSSIKHRSLQFNNDFHYSIKNMWSFRPKVDSPNVAPTGVIKVDSTSDKQRSTTRLIKDRYFLLGLYCCHC